MWPQAFIDAFTDAGYQVIRFDYRGVGNSDWVLNWKEETYSISDLAKDAAVILDTLKVQEVHIVGMSLGGMVAEEFALRNPERVLTLTTLMSSSNIYDPNLPKASGQVVADFTKIGLKYGLMPSEKNAVKMMLAAQVILRGDAQYNLDVREVTEQVLYNLRERKGFNPEAGKQHDQAARLWGDHDEELKMLDIPALIIHGKNDPFVSSDHSEKLASLLPNAKSKWFFNMGHDLPPDLIGELTKTIMHFYETTAYERAK